LALRKTQPEFVKGDLLLDEIRCDNPQVMSFIRKLGDKASLVLANFNDKPQTSVLKLDLAGYTLRNVKWINPQTSAESTGLDQTNGATVTLAPFEVLVGQLQPTAGK
jgi:Maltogenic Amylase, C-terminal domain